MRILSWIHSQTQDFSPSCSCASCGSRRPSPPRWTPRPRAREAVPRASPSLPSLEIILYYTISRPLCTKVRFLEKITKYEILYVRLEGFPRSTAKRVGWIVVIDYPIPFGQLISFHFLNCPSGWPPNCQPLLFLLLHHLRRCCRPVKLPDFTDCDKSSIIKKY